MDLDDGKSVWKCEFCDKRFSKRTYRKKHIQRIHKLDSNGQAIPTTHFTCDLCNKVYTHKNKLVNHINTIHFPQKTFNCDFCPFKSYHKFNLKKHIIRIHQRSGSKPKPKIFKCSLCDRAYTRKAVLMSHVREKHNIKLPIKNTPNRKCPLCPFTSTKKSTEEINNHFEVVHDIQIEHEEHNFKNVEEFYEWKKQIELKSKTSFFKTGSLKHKCIYLCHRKGNFISKGQNKRHLKIMGTCKINAHCPAEMRVKINENGNVTVFYVPRHVGHENELRFIRLRDEDRKNIAYQLISKTHDAILQGVRSSLSNQELERIHLLNKKDLINIENSFNIKAERERQTYDPVSEETWAEKLRQSTADRALLGNLRKRSLSMLSEDILEDGSDHWQVRSSSTAEFHEVKRVQQCNACELKCLHCNSQVHEFICTCMDHSLKNNLCKHIYAVARTLYTKDNLESRNSEDRNLIIHVETSRELNLETTMIEELGTKNDVEKRKECIKTICKEILQALHSSTSEQDNFLLGKLQETLATFEAMKSYDTPPIPAFSKQLVGTKENIKTKFSIVKRMSSL